MLIRRILALGLLFLNFRAGAESFRTIVTGSVEVSLDRSGGTIPMKYNDSVLISIGEDTRFFRGIELELSAPQRWSAYQGSLAVAIYAGLDGIPPAGTPDVQGQRIAFEPLPGKIQIIYQIPIRRTHGLRSTPYVTVPAGVTLPSSFPILFRIMPVVKGMSEELEAMVFQFSARPVLSDEGAVILHPRYPEQLRGRPFTVLIDDVLIPNHGEEQVLKEGEHRLVILSEDYRNESRRFVVERTKILDLNIELQDPAPLLIFEAPQNARIFLNNAPVPRDKDSIPVEPGIHEAKFFIGDYTITKTVVVQRGKTYRVVLVVDVDVLESE
jgi:hypothetical protein